MWALAWCSAAGLVVAECAAVALWIGGDPGPGVALACMSGFALSMFAVVAMVCGIVMEGERVRDEIRRGQR